MAPFDPESVTHFIRDVAGTAPIVVHPTPEELARLRAAYDAAEAELDVERPWQPCDDLPPPASGTFAIR